MRKKAPALRWYGAPEWLIRHCTPNTKGYIVRGRLSGEGHLPCLHRKHSMAIWQAGQWRTKTYRRCKPYYLRRSRPEASTVLKAKEQYLSCQIHYSL